MAVWLVNLRQTRTTSMNTSARWTTTTETLFTVQTRGIAMADPTPWSLVLDGFTVGVAWSISLSLLSYGGVALVRMTQSVV